MENGIQAAVIHICFAISSLFDFFNNVASPRLADFEDWKISVESLFSIIIGYSNMNIIDGYRSFSENNEEPNEKCVNLMRIPLRYLNDNNNARVFIFPSNEFPDWATRHAIIHFWLQMTDASFNWYIY